MLGPPGAAGAALPLGQCVCATCTGHGTEFINAHLVRYCEEQQIDFTRRAYRKNDNNFTELKNFDVVRKHVGYVRYDTRRSHCSTSCMTGCA